MINALGLVDSDLPAGEQYQLVRQHPDLSRFNAAERDALAALAARLASGAVA